MAQQTQFSVSLSNKPGMLAHLCQMLAAAGVNLRAISVAESTEQAVVRFVPTTPGRARKVLESDGLAYNEMDVIVLTMPDKPGALGKAAASLAVAKVNINYVYSGATASKGRACVVMAVSDVDKARKVLKA